MPAKVTIGCAVAALLLPLLSGPVLSGQGHETQPPTTKSLEIIPIAPTPPHAGAQMFKQYCASCHGVNGRGDGPAVAFLKAPPPDLRMMARRNNGKYPALDVKAILTFGPGSHAHGALDMPTWGPLFRSLDQSSNDGVANQRIYNLSKFIESIQEN